ncbi:enoyl-CoA hydratase-related protein [Streptomyces sp. NPDC090088]|uniref:enoyl-CoA hydratase-related protein n=1 Tax=Streptomyces sp. NPDC090088 TaxID=3365944 RepID=UPI00380E0F9B
MDSHRSILFEVIDHVAWITLNRRGTLNAVDHVMAGELREAWSEAATKPGVAGVVVVGAGSEAFSLGIDRSPGSALAQIDSFMLPELGLLPLVVAVNGMACAEALTLLRAADSVVAAQHACFCPGRPPVRQRATDVLTATEANAAGLVETVVPLKRLRTEAQKTVTRLAEGRDSAPDRWEPVRE